MIPRQGAGKHAQAGHWQTFPGRELAKHPRQGLQNLPRQGTGKRSQAGHWQTFPGRELASGPRQGTGKCPRQGQQACPGRAGALASVPRQGTGKRPKQGLQTCPSSCRALANVPRQGTADVPMGIVVVPRHGTVGIAKEPRDCTKKFSNDMPPTPEVPLHRQPAICCVMSSHAWMRDYS